MRIPTMVLGLLPLAALLLWPAAAQPAETPPTDPHPLLRITELLPNPDAAAGQREFIELHNAGNVSVPLLGWRIEDAATASGAVNGFTFPDLTLGPGARLVVWSNAGGDARGPAWSTSANKTVWNDAGDAATLLDPEGNVADWLAYGNAQAAAPAGFANASRPAAPARGTALALLDGQWTEAAPTPALAPGMAGGVASASVANAAPTASLAAPPAAKPGETVRIAIGMTDGNGDGDVATWTLRAGGTVLAAGNASATTHVAVRAPTASGPWPLELNVTDRSGASAVATALVQVRDARLAVDVPATGGIAFPPLSPGQRNVTSLEPFRVRNDGTDAAPVLLDVSAFSGPGTIPAEGNLWVGLAPAGNASAAPQWLRYERPLQPLPLLPAGAAFDVWLRIDTVPSPLPAGSYGTSFTVVSA